MIDDFDILTLKKIIPHCIVIEKKRKASLCQPVFKVKEKNMSSTGTVKWFNTTKGYGFIQPDNGGADVFVHISAVEKAGLRTLNENEKVSYDLVTEKGKTSAGNLAKA